MKAAIAAVALLASLPTLAMAQSTPVLLNPADANRDGTVSAEEKADYLARDAAQVQNTPGLAVSTPKPGAPSIFKPVELPEPGTNTGAAGAPPSQASDFEKATEARIRKDS